MNYNIIISIILFFATTLEAQTYIQGEEVIPISDIVISEYLHATNRLSNEDAFSKLKILYPNDRKKKPTELVGEFWFIDNMLVNIVSRTIPPSGKEDLEQLKYAYRPEGAGSGKAYAGKYYDEVKRVNNFEVLISYFRFNNFKYFQIQDNQGRYKLSGKIICTKDEIAKAESFMNTLLNSITFK